MKILLTLSTLIFLASCGNQFEPLSKAAKQSEDSQAKLAKLIAEMPEVEKGSDSFIEPESERSMGIKKRASLINKAREKRENSSLFRTNESIIQAMKGHTKVYNFRGKYKVIVIPVQFSDVKFEDADFFKTGVNGNSKAQDYVFGDSKESMKSYYKHVSLGNLHLEGEVTSIITMDKPLAAYGEAVANSNDRNARGLVVETLKKLKKIKTNDNWWLNYDNWDLSDYDRDKNFHEPDGFIDAVILVYAGKSQASCQRSFDTEGTRPASADVPAGPRQAASIECFNRIWPHRWSIALSSDSPDYTTVGPMVEGVQRPAMNGFKINDNLFALDYNMQSEFSDRSTFIHEFGHSLSLPDVYSRGKSNSTGNWEVMSSNANLQAQEMSTYSKMSLGWVSPKVLKQGEVSSAYLGNYNFVTKNHRRGGHSYTGPSLNGEDEHILSAVPDSGESVYRSVVVLTEPTRESREVAPFPSNIGTTAAYSGRFDGETRSINFSFDVPLTGDASLSFDTYFAIETETNFNSKDPEVKVMTDYDIGQIMINGDLKGKLRLISGDTNNNGLADLNKSCEEEKVLSLRAKKIAGTISETEEEDFKQLTSICREPIWVKKSYDLSSYRGQSVEFAIDYITDGGYTELGIIVDNIKLPSGEVVDFEDAKNLGAFKALRDGKEELIYNQFYMFEYRDPSQSYVLQNKALSYNMDKNIAPGNQSFFTDSGSSDLENFRMVTYRYRPGVVAWYYNSKFGRTENDPRSQEGRGYLLVLNSKVQDIVLPGFNSPEFRDEKGDFFDVNLDDGVDNALEVTVKEQREKFVCFSHTKYATYLKGEAPVCHGQTDILQTLNFEGKDLLYRRERFNEYLPITRYKTFGVGVPHRTGATIRTGLATFNPASKGEFKPFKVYKHKAGEMVIDSEMTENTVGYMAVDSFNDADSILPANPKFQGDTVVVEKKGFNFKVASPSTQIHSRYSDKVSGDDNDNIYRAPKVKLYFSWQ